MAGKQGRRPTKFQLAIGAAGFVVLALVVAGYWIPLPWTGFGAYTTPKSDTVEYIHEKTVWDWLQLLVIPAVLLIAGVILSRIDRDRERQITERQATRDKLQAEARAETEQHRADLQAQTDREIARDRLEEAMLQDYLDRMSLLILNEQLASSLVGDPLRSVARARTLTVLSALTDGKRKGSIVQFLYEAQLITSKEPIIDLEGCDLRGTNLQFVWLNNINLRRSNLQKAQLQMAKMEGAIFSGCTLLGSDLRWASFVRANFTSALIGIKYNLAPNDKRTDMELGDFTEAVMLHTGLCGVNLRKAKLCRANLTGADLSKADLTGADLTGADLTKTNLTEAIVTEEQLSKVKSLKGATMPDGSTHD